VAVPYVPGRDIDYYIAAAGGTSRLAERKRAFVQQPDGKFEARHRYPLVSNVRPRPGAIVTVPERDPAQQGNIVGIVTAVAQVVGSLVGIIAIVAR